MLIGLYHFFLGSYSLDFSSILVIEHSEISLFYLSMNYILSILSQADLLRQQTLQQLQRILTTRQTARALLVINDYFSRLRALSSLWLARPRE